MKRSRSKTNSNEKRAEEVGKSFLIYERESARGKKTRVSIGSFLSSKQNLILKKKKKKLKCVL